MALALYRRYRPDTFEGVIGQDQVTIPLMRALDAGKLTHAYLFSGPRGCGKTSSARILARCINCVKGPTSHPCGECESCKDLATGGPGSIDVVEIDAASHNGVDDARELRERAGFAPARDRYKIFILDEAHMVTQQGFNALLKIVEEPPEHVMFIFATTEPDKVIGTIRSRTHHYPFRLVPQEIMGPYLEQVCAKEGIKPEPGVLRLAMRAGGGSMRDTLSVLDQLMVGAVDGVITHDASVALLGFTPEELIGQAIDAVIDRDGEALYAVIQKVVVGGFDPRRFVEDLLARVRDLLVLTLAGERAESVLSDDAEGVGLDDLKRQAGALGLGPLTVMADTINTALGSMSGATSPRMRLELLAARLLAGREQGNAAALGGAAASGMPSGVARESGAMGGAPVQTAVRPSSQGGFAGASRRQGTGAVHGQGGFVGAARNAAGAEDAVAAGSTASHAAQSVSGFVGRTGVSEDQSVPGISGATVKPSGSSAADASKAVRTSPASGPVDGGESQLTQLDASPSQPSQNDAAQQTVSGPRTPESGQTSTSASVQAAGAAADDTRTPDERWDALVAALPEDVRRYVGRDRLPRIKLDGDPKSGPARLWLKFDVPLSKYAFAMGMASEPVDGATKVVDILRAEVRRAFGSGTSIAPTNKMANGEIAPPMRQLPVDEQQRIKAKLLQENLGASMLGTASGLTGHGHDTEETAPEQSGAVDDDDAHRATSPAKSGDARQTTPSDGRPALTEGRASADDDDPWARPIAQTQRPVRASESPRQPQADAKPEDDDDPWGHPIARPQPAAPAAPAQPAHAHKHVAVPDMSDDDDPWTHPIARPGAQGATPQASAASAGPAGPPASAQPAASFGAGATGMRSAAYVPPAGDEEPSPAPQYDDDPWKDVPPPSAPGPVQEPGTPNADPWNQAASVQSAPAARSAQTDGATGDDEDEYSMNDESLGASTAMSVDELTRFFDVKKVEEFAADDPRNPRNVHPKTHAGEE